MFGLFQRGAAAIKDWATNDIWDYISRRPATQEKLKAGPGAKIPYFMPYLDENQTAGETAEIRAAYRRMLADPDIKAAWLNKLLGVMALDLNIRPYKKKHPRHKIIADFVKWNLTTRLYEGVPGLIWDVLSGATIDGWSLCEPKWVVQDDGEYRGKLVLQRLKAKDVWQDLVPLVDEHRNIVSIRGLRYNDGTEYSPKDFIIYTHLGMYENPIGTSDFRAAYASWWFLDTVTKLRAMGAERRALPIVMGEYPSTDKQSALETALSAIKWRNWIAVPKDVKLQAIDMAGKADEIFGSFTRDLRERIWIGLDGATLQSMQSAAGAVRGNSQVHKDTADLRKWYLSAAITHVLNDYEHGIIREMVDVNFVGAEGYPTASLGGVDAAELKEDLAIAQGLQQMGWIHSREEIEDRFSWPWGEGDDALQMPQQGMGGMGGIGGLLGPAGGPAGGMDPAGGGDEDPRAKADPIADILGGLYGEKADAALGGGEAESPAGPAGVESYAEEDWVHAPGPRSQNRWRQLRTGRIEYSVENPGKHEGKSLPAEAKDKRPEIRKAAVELVEKLRSDASARTPENAKALVDHLGKLTIAEIHEIKRQYGLKAGASWKSALVEKVADRLQNGMPARQDRARKDRWKDPSDGQEQESTTTLPQEVMEHLQNHAKTLDTQIKTEEATLAKEIEDARKRGLDVGSPPSDGRGTSAGDQGTPREDRAAPSGAGQIEKDPDPHGGRGGVDRDAFIAERVRAAKTGVKSLSGRKEAEKKARAVAEAEWDAKQKPAGAATEAKEAASPTKAYDAVLQAVANAGSPVVDLSDLRKQMPEGMQGEEFNAAVLALADDQKLSIAQDSDPGKWSPEERAGFVTEGDKVYTTASVHPSYTPEKETSKVKAGGEGDAGSWLTEYSGLSDAQSKLKWHQKVNDSLATQGNGPKIGDSFKLKDGRTATVSLKGEAKNGQPVFGLDVADHALRLPGTSGGAGKKDRIAERPASDLLLMGWKPDAGPTPATEKPTDVLLKVQKENETSLPLGVEEEHAPVVEAIKAIGGPDELTVNNIESIRRDLYKQFGPKLTPGVVHDIAEKMRQSKDISKQPDGVASQDKSTAKGLAKTSSPSSDEVQNTGDAEKEPVNYANVVTIAADNVSKLRKQDVYRVLDAMRSPEELTGMSEYLLANRPDLEEMIRDNEQEIHHERGYHGEQQLLENRGGGSDQSGLPSGQPVGSVTGEPRQQISSEAQGGAGSGRGLERVPTSQGVGGDGRGSDTGEAGGRSAASELDGQVRDAAGSAERGGLRGSAGDGGDDASAGRIPSEVARAPFKYKDRNFLPVGKKGKFWANIAALKLAKELDAEGREATDEERETLSKYSGWGQFPAVFNEYGNPEDLDGENPREWTKERTALKAILGDDEYRSASKSTLNAHYTEPAIVDLQWKLAERLGFKGGQGNRFLEPSAGVGYYLGMMPDHLRQGTKVTAVEKDAGTGSILKSLYPSDRIEVKGYEEHKAPNDFYDMAASNVPFGDYGVHDKKYDKYNANIHDYFFLKSLDQVRPGGLLMHVTSAGTLDKANRSIREAIAEKADLVGAIRLPAGTHKQAGTDVVTDMLVFKKREHGEPHGDKTWLDTTTVPDPAGGEPIPVNAYFAAHPEQVIGQIDRSGKMYHGAQVSVSRPDDFEARLEKAVENFPKDVMTPRTAPRSRFSPEALPAAGHVKDGGFTIQNGKVFRREGDSMTEQRMSAEQTARLGGLMAVRDAARQVINDQVAGKSPVESQAKLSQIYDKFVKAYGPLNSKDNRKIYQGDPDAYLIQSIEHYDDESKTARKGVFFSKETVSPAIDPTKVENVSDGVGVSLNRFGRLDVDHIAKLTGRTVADVSYELTSKGLAFQDPAGDKWHPADYYLSGNVKAKLRDAEEAAKTDPKYRANVEALKKVQPPDKHHEDIVVKIGAPWIPASDMANFAATLLGGRADHFDIANTPGGGWTASYTKTGKDRHWSSKIANSQWGTADKRFIDLLELTLNSRSAKITRTDYEGKTYTDVQATQDAQLKQEAIREAFKEWIWTDDERRERLAKHFNDHFNTTVDFNPDGSHLTLPGTTMEVRPHVKDFIWRTVTQGRSLGGHEVGMGKTRAMAGSAMELRRMGLAKKPAIACLKANVEAVTREAQEMYPGAKIISTVDMFSADKRKSTIARIATGDYDMVIMTHDNLDMIQMLPETRKKYIEQELNEIKTALVQANKSSNDGGYRRGKPQKSNIVKQLEKQLERKEVALKDAIENGRKDDVVYFEELGIDHLIVDEAHKYKNAPVYTQMDNVKGISSQPSDRATNMLMRTQYLLEKHNGRGVTFMTGTPMANSISELYNVQRYLQPDLLKEQGLNSFDAWASTFTEPKTSWEFTPAGEYKPVTRLVKFANVSNLMAGARQVLDVQKIDDINAKSRAKGGEDIIKRPKPTVIPHQAPNTPAQKKLMETIVARAQAIKGQKPGVPGADNMLAICTDGAKGALDLRLLDANAADDPQSKVNIAIGNVLDIYKAKPGKTQLIFSDLGVNPMENGFHLYADIINKLVAGGIPRHEIADFSKLDGAKKEAAQAAMKKGQIRIGIGGTDKLGTGVNVQTLLSDVHHLDTPYVPASIEQRDGRAHRQGNTNAEIGIHRYVTAGSLDQFRWTLVSKKKAMIDQVVRPGTQVSDVIEEPDTEEVTPEMMEALASENPLLMKKISIDHDLKTLTDKSKAHAREQARLRKQVDVAERTEVPTLTKAVERMKGHVAHFDSHGSGFEMKIGDKTYTDRKEAAEAWKEVMDRPSGHWRTETLGHYKGFDITRTGSVVRLQAPDGETYGTTGGLSHIEAIGRRIGNDIAEHEGRIVTLKAEAEKLKRDIGKPFAKAKELEEMQAQSRDIEQQLQAASRPKVEEGGVPVSAQASQDPAWHEEILQLLRKGDRVSAVKVMRENNPGKSDLELQPLATKLMKRAKEE